MKRVVPQPPRKLVAALDVGSSKISALIAEPGEDGELRILGTGQRESLGVKRGYVADMERTEAAIREAVEQAERIAATNVEQVFVGYSAGGSFDLYTRVIARHFSKHVPGNPTTLVENMTGASGIIAALNIAADGLHDVTTVPMALELPGGRRIGSEAPPQRKAG